MKKLLLLLLTLCLLMPGVTALGEDALLDELLEGIEGFDPTEPLLPLPEDELFYLSADSETVTLNVANLQAYGISFDQLMSNERYTCLPCAALSIAAGTHYGFTPEELALTIYCAKDLVNLDLYVILLDSASDRIYLLRWTPGSASATCQRGRGITSFLNTNAQAISSMTLLEAGLMPPYYSELRNGGFVPLSVNRVTYALSEDRQSIYLDRPVITGGSGRYTIAYNIYDSLSNPINYFYSTEERVAATPGCGGLFNVFVVVTDTMTGETATQNIGWQNLSWPRAEALTVGKPVFELSEDGKSIYLNRPAVACQSGEATIAYNLYDDQGNPVNYFYSVAPRVAVTPGYDGVFNVFVVVTDTVTGESLNQDIGWLQIGDGTENTGTARALLIAQTHVPNCNTALSFIQDAWSIGAVLKYVNKGAYEGNIVTRQNLTQAQVLAEIASAYSGAKAGDVSFFYIGTHGIKTPLSGTSADQEGALSCADGKSLKLKDLASALSKANPNNEVIVLISADGSGAAVKGDSRGQALEAREIVSAFAAADPGLTGLGSDGGETKRQELRKNKFYVLTSTDTYESSWYFPDSEPAGSFAGLALTRALSSNGTCYNADANNDRKITFDELYNYMYYYCYNASVDADARQHMQRWPESSDWVVFTY